MSREKLSAKEQPPSEDQWFAVLMANKRWFLGFLIVITLGGLYLFALRKLKPDEILNSTVLNVFSGMVSSIISLLIAAVVYKKYQNEEVARKLLQHLRSAGLFDAAARDAASVMHSGVLSVIHPRKKSFINDVRDRMLQAKPGNEIVIVDSWLCQDISEFLLALELGVMGALKRGAKVRFVLMHPQSPLLPRREKFLSRAALMTSIERSVEIVSRYYLDWCKECESAPGRTAAQLELYFVDTYLSMQIYSLPGISYAGYYAANETSTHGPHVVAIDGTLMGELFKNYVHRTLEFCTKYEGAFGIKAEIQVQQSGDVVSVDGKWRNLLPCQVDDMVRLSQVLEVEAGVQGGYLNTVLCKVQANLLRYGLKHCPDSIRAAVYALEQSERRQLKMQVEEVANQGQSQALEQMPPQTREFISKLKGRWYGVHRTRNKKGEEVNSEHRYELEVFESSCAPFEFLIGGYFDEIPPDEPEKFDELHPYRFTLEGRATANEIHLVARRLGETSVTLIRIGFGGDVEEQMMHGMYLFHDYGGTITTTPIALTKRRVGVQESFRHMREHNNKKSYLLPMKAG